MTKTVAGFTEIHCNFITVHDKFIMLNHGYNHDSQAEENSKLIPGTYTLIEG